MDEVFSFSNIGGAWSTENYKESIAVSFTWTKDNDKDVILANRQFDFYRNKKTTITLTVVDQSLTPGLAISLEASSVHFSRFSVRSAFPPELCLAASANRTHVMAISCKRGS